MTKNEIATLVTLALAACPTPASFLDGKAIAAMNLAWQLLLSDVDVETATTALKRTLIDCDGKIPAPGQIRKVIAAMTVGDVQPGAVAFGAVLGLLKSTKEHRGYHTSDPPPRAVVERFAGALGWQALQAIGGWRAICTAEENDPAPRSQFVRVYDALAANERRNVVSNSLPAVATYLALRSDDARQAALPEGATDLEKRGADAWALPTSAGAHVAGIVKAMTGGAS